MRNSYKEIHIPSAPEMISIKEDDVALKDKLFSKGHFLLINTLF